MTYMSIEGAIEDQVEAGRLVCLWSEITGDETTRTMYVSREILEAVIGPFAENRDGERLSEFRQTLDSFLEGGEFSVAEDPHCKPSDAMIARIDPVTSEIWDIRSVAPSPGIRALGGFAKKDTFITLTWNYRENLDGPGEWSAEIERCISAWCDLFGSIPPFHGATLHDYLSNFYAV